MISRIIFFFCSLFIFFSANAQDEVYELRVYHTKFGTQENKLHKYFENALIPALNRQGISLVGAFEEASEALPRKLYLVIPYKNMDSYQEVIDKLWEDDQYTALADSLWSIAPENFPYKSYESSFIRSSKGFPKIIKPSDSAEFFELRTYEAYSEDALRRKLKMFNEDEFGIFQDIGFPIVFFGKNISGDRMPSLTYMLATNNKAEDEKAWERFGKNPVWQRISGLKEYANTVSNITRVFLKPLPYSQL